MAPVTSNLRLKKRFSNGKLKLSKFLHQRLVMPKPTHQVIALILGCQRSGTTMLLNVFERDLRTKSYSENGWLKEYWPRMMPVDRIHDMLADDRVPLVIAKPLMESQRTLELLDEFPNAKAIWAHRGFAGVANSRVKKFGEEVQFKLIRLIVEGDETEWSSERLPVKLRELVRSVWRDDMTAYDAAALFWYVRNELFFTQDLGSNPRVRMCRYEEMASDPIRVIYEIYAFLGLEPPSQSALAKVHGNSISKGRDLALAPEIHNLCVDMDQRLMKTHNAQQETVG
ncbi:MAG: sulfotransferase domain-containing protein [Pseudomonadota bacterium]